MTHAVAKPPRKLRVLMTHWDGSGNIPPQRALARELDRRGHEVHVLSHDTLAEAVTADGGRFHALPSAPQWNPDALSFSDGVEARSFVPHDAVLPSVDLVVTHAGFGTLMYSAGAGKPTLCLPNGRDQNDNAARVEALGLGRTLSPDASPAEIGSAVMDMLDDEALRAASRSFASGVSRFGELTHAAELIERAVSQVLGSTQGRTSNRACAAQQHNSK